MRRKCFLVSIYVVVTLLLACNKDEYVRFDTLSKYGEEFFMGQKVAVWAGVDVSDKEEATYEWSCSDGHFEGPQNIFRNTWVAPYEKGVYTVTCTVRCNGKSDSRTTKMVVSEYFFERFDFPTTLFTATNVNPTYKNGKVYIVGSRANTQGRYYYTFTDPDLVPPFTLSEDVGREGEYKNASTTTNLILRFTRPTENGVLASRYIRYIGIDLLPTAEGTTRNFKFYINEINTKTQQNKSTDLMYEYVPECKFTEGVMKNFNITIDSDYTMIVKVDGVEIVRSASLKQWRDDNSIDHPLILNSFECAVYDKCNICLDNIYLYKQ